MRQEPFSPNIFFTVVFKSLSGTEWLRLAWNVYHVPVHLIQQKPYSENYLQCTLTGVMGLARSEIQEKHMRIVIIMSSWIISTRYTTIDASTHKCPTNSIGHKSGTGNNGCPDRVHICSESLMSCKLEKNSWVGWFGLKQTNMQKKTTKNWVHWNEGLWKDKSWKM